MADMMQFPQTFEEFIHDYAFNDRKEVYTNNAELIETYRVFQAAEYYFGKQPAADVVEVKHGKWYSHDKKIHGDTCYHCSECEKMALTDCGMVWELTPYCPFCGAKMDGGKENE